MILHEIVSGPVKRLREGIARALARIGVSPDLLTVLGLLVNIGAGALLALGYFRWAALIILFAGAFDTLDGALARVSGTTSPFGAFLDSTVDRYSDMVLFAGLIVHYLQAGQMRPVVLAVSALAGSLLVSYTRARAECLIPSCEVGFLQRGERIVLLILAGLVGNMLTALWILATLTHWTVLVRVHHTRRTIAGRAVRAANTVTGQIYHIVFWDFRRDSVQFDIAALAVALCVVLLRV